MLSLGRKITERRDTNDLAWTSIQDGGELWP